MGNLIKTEMIFQFGPPPYTKEQFPQIIESMENFVDQLHERYSDLCNGIEWHKRADEYRKQRDKLKDKLNYYKDVQDCPYMDVLCYSKNPCSNCIVHKNWEANFDPSKI